MDDVGYLSNWTFYVFIKILFQSSYNELISTNLIRVAME